MIDTKAMAASLTGAQKARVLDLLRAKKLPREAIDEDLLSLRLLRMKAGETEKSELNNDGWAVAMLLG